MVYQGEFTHRITEVSNKAFNNPHQELRLERPVTPVSPLAAYPAIATHSAPRHPELSAMIDGHLEGPSTQNQAHHETEEKPLKEPTKGGQCSYLSCIVACTSC